MIKLLMRLIYGKNDRGSAVDAERMNIWLVGLLSETSGYKDYYTFRKRHLLDSIAVGLEQKEYWVAMGRLQEIKYLGMVAEDVLKKDKVSDKKK